MCILALIQETHCEQISLEAKILTKGTSDKAKCNILEQGYPSLWCQSKACAKTVTKQLELKEDVGEDWKEAMGGMG